MRVSTHKSYCHSTEAFPLKIYLIVDWRNRQWTASLS